MKTLKPGFCFGGPLQQILPPKLWIQTELEALSPEKQKPLTPFPSDDIDSHFMLEALKVSLTSVGISNPNPAVGCVLVNAQGKELARGTTQAYLGPHAERNAFDKVSNPDELAGGTAYVTLEPCSHYGNQPPCVELLISSPLKRVVIARIDPNPLVSGEGIRKLIEAGKEVSVGLYHAETTAWNFPFFAYQTLKRPIFILKWAQTLDGQLADDQGHSKWITGPIARSYTHWLRQRYDTILVGASTVLADAPQLNVRDCGLPHQAHPMPILFDPRGKLLGIDKKQKERLLIKTLSEDRKFVYVTTPEILKASPHSWLHELPNATLLPITNSKNQSPTGNELIDGLTSLIRGPEIANALGRPLQSVMVEGGPKTLTLFLNAGYADALHIFLAPMLSGGNCNRIQLMQLFADAKRFELISNTRLGPDLVMEMVSTDLKKLFQAI